MDGPAIGLRLLSLLWLASGVVAYSNFVAPAADSPFKKSAIVPYSVYRKTLEEQKLLSSTSSSPEEVTTSPSVFLYLPPFSHASENEISKSEPMPEGKFRHDSHETNTKNRRDPLQYQTSIFRPQTSHLVTSTSQRVPPAHGQRLSRPGISTSLDRSYPDPASNPRRFPFSNAQAQGVPINSELSPQTVYKSVLPAPYSSLPAKPSGNIVDNIFSQSQSNLRFAPPASLGLQPPMNPIHALGPTPTGPQPDALGPLTALLGGGSPLEQISKLARNLLSLPAGNRELLNAVTKALGTGTVSEGAKLTSSAVLRTGNSQDNETTVETVFSSAKDDENNNTQSSEVELTPDQRALLAAAIENGELNMTNVAQTVKLTKSGTSAENSNKLIDWIQQNRPKESVFQSGDKLPYYGRYCGTLVEKAGHNQASVSGALWVVDESRLLVSKFHFKPRNGAENVTFWAGPSLKTGTETDFVPGEHGYYLTATPVETSLLLTSKTKVVSVRGSDDNSTAEAEEMEDDSTSTNRIQRDIPLRFSSQRNQSDGSVNLTITSPNAATPNAPHESMKALDWYAGFQPLLLTLPPPLKVRDISWVSVYDHKQHESLASVLIPNDPGFRIPASVSLRPLTPNGKFDISSGKIKVLNTKTIEIERFHLRTKGMPTWFMVGRDILPHKRGIIVPIYNTSTNTFDCDSLRDYHNETVTLRLPGSRDMKDVFWFSVFSIPRTTSMAHIYLPYNDLQLPPDLSGVTAPECRWRD